MDRKSSHSTGLCPLCGPCPKRPQNHYCRCFLPGQLGIVISVHPVDFNSFLAFSGQKPVETVDFNSFLTSTKATRFVTSKMCLVVKMTSFTNKFFCSIIFMACWPVRKKPQLFRMLQFRDGNERPSFIRKCTFGQTLIKKNYVL